MRMNDETLDCLVAGDANVDLIIDGAPELEYDKEKLAEGVELTLGGSSAITAYNLASLGVKTAFAGVIGSDLFGDFVVNSLTSGRSEHRVLTTRRAPKNWPYHLAQQKQAARRGYLSWNDRFALCCRYQRGTSSAFAAPPRGPLFSSDKIPSGRGGGISDSEGTGSHHIARLQL